MSPKQELMSIIENQKTVTTKKLKRLLNQSYIKEITYLKGETAKLSGKVKRQQKVLRRMKDGNHSK